MLWNPSRADTRVRIYQYQWPQHCQSKSCFASDNTTSVQEYVPITQSVCKLPNENNLNFVDISRRKCQNYSFYSCCFKPMRTSHQLKKIDINILESNFLQYLKTLGIPSVRVLTYRLWDWPSVKTKKCHRTRQHWWCHEVRALTRNNNNSNNK